MSFAILTDTTRCTGCERCVDACVEINHLSSDMRYRWRELDGLNGARYTSVVHEPGDHYVRLQCRHCLEPACAAVCPVGALHKTADGPVVYDREICMGCRYCMMACPYEIPRYMWEKNVPYISKCTMCYEAMRRGDIDQPACTKACPEEATVFFTSREEALDEGRRRIADNPGVYFSNRIWGEHEVGGTAVLYISDVDLARAGWPEGLGEAPRPALARQAVTAAPAAFGGVLAFMVGVHWTYERRKKVQAWREAERRGGEGGDGGDR